MPDIFSIPPPAEDDSLIQYAPYVEKAAEAGMTPLSPVKSQVKRCRYKRERVQSTTSSVANKRQSIHHSPYHASDGQAGLVVDRMEGALSVQPVQLPDYTTYLEFVLADCAGFYQISRQLCVVQGWDGRKQEVTVNKSKQTRTHVSLTDAGAQRYWYHLQFAQIGGIISLACMCPAGGQGCVHEQFLQENKNDYLPDDGTFAATGE